MWPQGPWLTENEQKHYWGGPTRVSSGLQLLTRDPVSGRFSENFSTLSGPRGENQRDTVQEKPR